MEEKEEEQEKMLPEEEAVEPEEEPAAPGPDDLVPLQVYQEEADAQSSLEALANAGIPAQMEELPPPFDTSLTGGAIRNNYLVKAAYGRREEAEQVLLEKARRDAEAEKATHYLQEFTDEELWEVLEKPDEWIEEDYQLARQLLQERGHEIETQKLETLKEGRVEELRKPERISGGFMALGIFSALLGGIFGILYGWGIWQGKKALPNGNETWAYDHKSRQFGKFVMVLGCIVLVVLIGLFVLNAIR